jgi:N-methylhydantoinase A
MRLLGVDTGGTFTDLVYLDGRGLRVHKVLSTPQAPEQAILRGLDEMGIDPQGLVVIHGSTVGTNAVLEGKGARVAYVANRGLGDVLTIGRQARSALYDLQPQPQRPPVPQELCLETGGRLGADGRVLEPLDEPALERLRRELHRLAPEAVAINLLYSFLDERFERAIEAVVPEGIFVSRSSAVLPELREYERGIATWLNSYVGPVVAGYLRRLRRGLAPARLKVMQSHGGAISAEQAVDHAVQLLLSGPAGGLMGVRYVAAKGGCRRLLSFDMGGTSTDVALIDGEIRLTSEGRIAGYPVAVPMVDMHTIGAGGGSIAEVDPGGLLQVGPESAGAQPGPACYGQGGTQATVTDANLVLGRLPASVALAGDMTLDAAAAEAALGALGARLGLSATAAALGVIRLANEHMAQALRVISLQRGLDPRDYTLVCFGGAGGLHVCDLARSLGMGRALVPVHAGVLSALGMLVSPPGRQLSRTVQGLLGALSDAEIDAHLQALAERGEAELGREGVTRYTRRDSLDLRYEGQSATLNVPWEGRARALEAFHGRHRRRFGHALDMPVELVNVRVGLSARQDPPELPPQRPDAPMRPQEQVAVHGCERPVPVFGRAGLAPGRDLVGPVLIVEPGSTPWVDAGWVVRADPLGSLLLERG